MENTLNKTELAGALSALGKLVCRTSPIPMYHAVQIESINNALFFRTHNSDEEIEFRMDAEGMDPFKIAMDFDLFRSIVKNSRNKNIKFEFADGKLSIDGVSIAPMEGDWDVAGPMEGDSVATMPLPWTFVNTLSAAAQLVDLKEPRKILHGINLSQDGITATNGKELFNCPYRFSLDDLTIPFPLALMATRAIGSGELKTWKNDFNVFFMVKIDKWSWTAKALPGAYPEWKRVMPKTINLKYSVSFTEEQANRLKSFLKSIANTRMLNGITLYRDTAGLFTLRDADGHDFSIPAEFDSNWDEFSIVIRKEILLHMLDEGHTKLRFSDTLGPFVGTGGIGQYVAMPLYIKKPHVQTEAQPEQTASAQTGVKPENQTEQNGPQPIPETSESVTEQIPPPPQDNPAIPNTQSTKEKPTMNESPTITHTVSTPMRTFAQNQEPANPLDELTAKIETMKSALKGMIDEATAMGRTIREVAISQRQKDREYNQTKRALERVRVATGAA